MAESRRTVTIGTRLHADRSHLAGVIARPPSTGRWKLFVALTRAVTFGLLTADETGIIVLTKFP